MNIFKKKESEYIYEDNYVKIIKCNIKDLDKNAYINWEYNRPVDIVRTSDISKYYINNKIKIIPGIIHVWKKKNKYVIFDGIHRLFAAIDSNEDMFVILQIYNTNDENKIKQEFLNINKSVSLPCIYTDFENKIKKNVCEDVVNYIIRDYPAFQSPSRKCFKYNYNRDNLIEFISTIDIDVTIKNIAIDIYNILIFLNSVAENNINKYNVEVPTKVKKYKFYLMYLQKEYIKKEIENTLNNDLKINNTQ